MIKSSELNLNLLVQNIVDSEMGMVLIETDAKSFIDVLVKETTYEDRQGMYGNDNHITVHLFPVLYNNFLKCDTGSDLTRCRMMAVQNIFYRWNSLGYNKSKAKSPFGSKKFNKYLDNIGYHKADYLILMVD